MRYVHLTEAKHIQKGQTHSRQTGCYTRTTSVRVVAERKGTVVIHEGLGAKMN
jgi:hypothetical protein